MSKRRKKLLDAGVGIALAVMIFLSAYVTTEKVSSSAWVTQSRVFSNIVREDSINLPSLITDPKNRKMLQSFMKAVTNAYIDFEMIPLNEGQTFMVVVNSKNEDISIENFVYVGRNLTISGTTEARPSLQLFVDKMGQQNYFDYLEYETELTGDGAIRFTIICYGKAVESYQDFFAHKEDV